MLARIKQRITQNISIIREETKNEKLRRKAEKKAVRFEEKFFSKAC